MLVAKCVLFNLTITFPFGHSGLSSRRLRLLADLGYNFRGQDFDINIKTRIR